ncbi:MAG TPA: helix-turn-helix domain-containing protein, partial [Verrucomicrobiae bacterium]
GEVAAHLETNARQIFADDSFEVPPARPARASLGDSARETLRRFKAGQSPAEIARQRDIVVGTVHTHLAEAAAAGEALDLRRFMSVEDEAEIEGAFGKSGFGNLMGAFDSLGGKYPTSLLRLYRAVKGAEQRQRSHGL